MSHIEKNEIRNLKSKIDEQGLTIHHLTVHLKQFQSQSFHTPTPYQFHLKERESERERGYPKRNSRNDISDSSLALSTSHSEISYGKQLIVGPDGFVHSVSDTSTYLHQENESEKKIKEEEESDIGHNIDQVREEEIERGRDLTKEKVRRRNSSISSIASSVSHVTNTSEGVKHSQVSPMGNLSLSISFFFLISYVFLFIYPPLSTSLSLSLLFSHKYQ